MEEIDAVAAELEHGLEAGQAGDGPAAAPPEPLIDVSLDLGSSEMSASFEIAWQDEQELGEVALQSAAAALAGVQTNEEVDLLYD